MIRLVDGKIETCRRRGVANCWVDHVDCMGACTLTIESTRKQQAGASKQASKKSSTSSQSTACAYGEKHGAQRTTKLIKGLVTNKIARVHGSPSEATQETKFANSSQKTKKRKARQENRPSPASAQANQPASPASPARPDDQSTRFEPNGPWVAMGTCPMCSADLQPEQRKEEEVGEVAGLRVMDVGCD